MPNASAGEWNASLCRPNASAGMVDLLGKHITRLVSAALTAASLGLLARRRRRSRVPCIEHGSKSMDSGVAAQKSYP